MKNLIIFAVIELIVIAFIIYGYARKEAELIEFEDKHIIPKAVEFKDKALRTVAKGVLNTIEAFEDWKSNPEISNPEATMPVKVRQDWRT